MVPVVSSIREARLCMYMYHARLVKDCYHLQPSASGTNQLSHLINYSSYPIEIYSVQVWLWVDWKNVGLGILWRFSTFFLNLPSSHFQSPEQLAKPSLCYLGNERAVVYTCSMKRARFLLCRCGCHWTRIRKFYDVLTHSSLPLSLSLFSVTWAADKASFRYLGSLRGVEVTLAVILWSSTSSGCGTPNTTHVV